jgi:GDP-D-mannose 3',5'-epimerase
MGVNLMKKALVLGAGGFIGHHLVNRLKTEAYNVTGVDLKFPSYEPTKADDFVIGNLTEDRFVERIIDRPYDEVYQLAADMGGAGYIFTGENDASVMYNSAKINLNILNACYNRRIRKIFYSSSACIYPEYNQLDPANPLCTEDSAYPASPDSEYGWEKLFSERLYLAFARNFKMDCKVARFHNIFGPLGAWDNGKEKSPAAICRKVARTTDGGVVEVWGDGEQTRSFLFVEECLDGVMTLMKSAESGPFNIGSQEMISINDLVDLVASIAGKRIVKKHIDGPTGVRGRNSNNTLVREKLEWEPSKPLKAGLEQTYRWIESMVRAGERDTK